MAACHVSSSFLALFLVMLLLFPFRLLWYSFLRFLSLFLLLSFCTYVFCLSCFAVCWRLFILASVHYCVNLVGDCVYVYFPAPLRPSLMSVFMSLFLFVVFFFLIYVFLHFPFPVFPSFVLSFFLSVSLSSFLFIFSFLSFSLLALFLYVLLSSFVLSSFLSVFLLSFLLFHAFFLSVFLSFFLSFGPSFFLSFCCFCLCGFLSVPRDTYAVFFFKCLSPLRFGYHMQRTDTHKPVQTL